MTDLLQRLADANPVSEGRQPPIAEVWRKVAASPPPPRNAWRRTGRWVAAALAVAVPVVAVVILALPLGGVRRHTPGRAVPTVSGAHGRSTLDPAAQRIALGQLRGRTGSVVVIDPRTGAIEALAGAGHVGAGTLLPPAATFDVVTAAAALDSGRYTAASRFSGASPAGTARSVVHNDDGQQLGRITLSQALSASANTVFARIGDALGPTRMTTYMERFGFYAPPSNGRFPASGTRVAGRLTLPTSGVVPLGPLSAGGGDLTATTVQMAIVAAAVANGGALASPRLTTGTTRVSESRVISPRTARTLTNMLRHVVTNGTGTKANLAGLQIAGKTGTAQVSGSQPHETVVSFIGFAPADHPTVAVAVLLRDPHGGFGGTEAAPIAARVIRALLADRH